MFTDPRETFEVTNQTLWWDIAKVEIDEIMFGFSEALKIKLMALGDNPMSLLSKKNPFCTIATTCAMIICKPPVGAD